MPLQHVIVFDPPASASHLDLDETFYLNSSVAIFDNNSAVLFNFWTD